MLVALVLAGVVQTAEPAPTFDARRRLDDAIAIARRESYRTGEIDWPALAAKVHAAGDHAADIVDLLPAYVTLTQELGDHHSFVRPSQAVSDGWRARHGGPLVVEGGPPPLPPITSTFRGRREIEWADHRLESGATARTVVVPRMFGGGAPAHAYATALVAALVTDERSVCGYIVDLRGNAGGNVWPMAAGLSPLLGEGPFGYVRNAGGAISHTVDLNRGAAAVPDGPAKGQVFARAETWDPQASLADRSVAVLLDDGVASSAEAVAVAFRGRPRTRSFGAATRGLATANREFDLGDGVTLGVASAWMVDRSGRHFPSGVPVDVAIAAPEPDQAVDPALEAAEQWLTTTPGCSA